MSSIVCNLCGADDYKVLYKAGVAQSAQIVECNKCGLMYANPRAAEPDQDLIADYDPDFVEEHIQDNMRSDKEVLQVRDYDVTRKFLAEHYPQRGKLLEVGSGLGFLLDYFRKDGWDVEGVEPNAGLNRHARKVLGLKVEDKILPDVGYPDNSFDVVLMIHVIEHVPSPIETLQEIFRVLKPGGTLVMETPRYDTLMFKLLGHRERSLSCDGHIYFFTSKTLREISQKAGFSVERADQVGRSFTIDRLAYNVGVVMRSKAVASLIRGVSGAFGLKRAALTVNVRDMERIYLKKPV
jgi:SAM-dependent methyltransferase